MALLTDREEIRRLLRRDAVWAAYALGDLSPDLWPATTWHAAGAELALVLRAFSFPILWASGRLESLVDELSGESSYSVQILPTALPALERAYDVTGLKQMNRFGLRDFAAVPTPDVFRLRSPDLAQLEALYRDGKEAGEAPEFFYEAMVERGVFYGIRDASGLAAVAGTHLVALEEKVATIGNVYTRRDCRGRGFARQTACAVAAELLALGIEVIALNTNQKNVAARRTYERLGFVCHTEYVEGTVVRK